MSEESDVEYSDLCQRVERDGESVDIQIYEDGDNGWILEVIDEFDNSTLWADHFDTDQAALDEALRTIEEEGIDSLIGPPSTLH